MHKLLKPKSFSFVKLESLSWETAHIANICYYAEVNNKYMSNYDKIKKNINILSIMI